MGKLETTLEVIVALLVGLAFLGAGLGGAGYQLIHPPVDRKLVAMFIGLAVLGALIMPSIFTALFPRVRSLYILVFPNGIGVLGGRRAGDPQSPSGPPPPGPPTGPPL